MSSVVVVFLHTNLLVVSECDNFVILSKYTVHMAIKLEKLHCKAGILLRNREIRV